MEVSEVRKQRLKEWVASEFDGRISSMCSYYRLPPTYHSYINQMISGHRKIGERAARALEKRCHRPEGWLDQPLVQPEPRSITFDKKLVAKLPEEDVQLIETFIDMMVARNENRVLGRKNVSGMLPRLKSPVADHRTSQPTKLKRDRGYLNAEDRTPPKPKRRMA